MNNTPGSRKYHLLKLSLAAFILVASSAFAGIKGDKAIVKETMGADGIHWQTQAEYRSAELVVTGPGGFRWQQSFASGDPLFLDFESLSRAYSPSGQYKYELVLTPHISAADRDLAQAARRLGEEVDFLSPTTTATTSGEFRVADGALVDPSVAESGELKLLHADNVYIDGSLCVGFDCVNGAGFGFDTIRLQENNLRIKFEDTSGGAFPSNDWQIIINSSANGGASYFAVQDFSAGRQVFKVEAGAPSNALYVDDGGRVGLGTPSPVVDLQIVSGNTPTLRLEQNGSSGFTAQSWDVAGNETNFFVRDATNGSALPMRIQPGAATNMIFIANDEQVGIGTSSPEADLHINHPDSDNFSTLRLTNAQGASEDWDVRTTTSGGFAISKAGTGQIELEVDVNGNVTVRGNIVCPVGKTINGVACTGS